VGQPLPDESWRSRKSARPAVQISATATPAATLPAASMPASTRRTPSGVVLHSIPRRAASSTRRCTRGLHRLLTLNAGCGFSVVIFFLVDAPDVACPAGQRLDDGIHRFRLRRDAAKRIAAGG